MNDMLISGNGPNEIEDAKSPFSLRFKMKNLRIAKKYKANNIEQGANRISIWLKIILLNF